MTWWSGGLLTHQRYGRLVDALPQQEVLGGFQEVVPVQNPLLQERTFPMGADAGQVDEGVLKHGNSRRSGSITGWQPAQKPKRPCA